MSNLSDTSMTTNVPFWIKKITALPIYREIALELIRRINEKETEISGFIKLISSDPVLTIQILKIANAGLFNYSRKISAVEKAVVVLGFEKVKDITVALSTQSLFQPQRHSEYVQRIWRHSLTTALAMKILAENFNSENKELLYFGGLLHDIGKLVLLAQLGEEYQLLLDKQIQDEIRLIDLENQYLGMNHAEKGVELATHWKLPLNLIFMIGGHHDDTVKDSHNNLAFLNQLLYLGNFIAHDLAPDRTEFSQLLELYPAFRDYITISETEYNHIREKVLREIRDQQEFLHHIQIGIS